MASNISRLPLRNAHASAAGRDEPGGLRARASAAAEIAARFADEVDRDGRFPKEAFDAIREQKLLGVLIPAALGGEDASVADVVDVCYILGRACASTRDDLCDASGEGRLPGPPRRRQRLAGRPAAPHRRATNCCWPPRPPKAPPAAISAPAKRRSRPRRRASPWSATPRSFPMAHMPTASSPPRGAPRAPPVRTRCWSRS